MSATDRQELSTHEFTAGLRALADMLDTDVFDGVQILDERHHPDQGESLGLLVSSEEAVRAFAARHPGAVVDEHRDEEAGSLLRVTAILGFGRGTGYGKSYASSAYKHAVSLDVSYLFPEVS